MLEQDVELAGALARKELVEIVGNRVILQKVVYEGR